jgi:hypothetical protein
MDEVPSSPEFMRLNNPAGASSSSASSSSAGSSSAVSSEAYARAHASLSDLEEAMQPIDRGKYGRAPGVKRYKCPYEDCRYDDDKKFNVQNHINGHSQVTPYACPIKNCGYEAKQKVSLLSP